LQSVSRPGRRISPAGHDRQGSFLESGPAIDEFKLDEQFVTADKELALLERFRPSTFMR
jgi:hypothetical protein